jgi:DmsE family decaheme c-type cytochrome
MRNYLKIFTAPAFVFLTFFLLIIIVWDSGHFLTEAKPQFTANATYVGSEQCLTCHQELLKTYEHTIHYKIAQDPSNEMEEKGCESCHGPGSLHSEDPSNVKPLISFSKESETPVEKQNEACLECHQKTHLGWGGSIHQTRELACATCHHIKENLTDRFLLAKETQSELCGSCHRAQRAKTLKAYHMTVRDGKLECTSCHNPHGTTTDKLLVGNSVNETCYRCHTEKRGPFLWQHPPVMENCLNCHDPHGSNHNKMLVTKVRRLCQRCHIETRHPTTPQTYDAFFIFNHSCANCHSQIHGSNHPSGVRFLR